MRLPLALAVAVVPAVALSAQRLTVEDAVQLALERNPGLQATRLRAEAAESNAHSVRGHLLPSVRVSDEQQHYDSPFALPFPGLGTFVARNINTNAFVASADQPLLGLLHISQDYSAASSGADSSHEQSLSVESSIREGIQTGYLRYFEAKALQEIAQASEKQLTEQHQVAESKLKAGVLTKADLLRLEVAQANAKQQEIQAQAQSAIARSALLITLGLQPADASIELVEPTALENAPVTTLDEPRAEELAVQNRHEVRQALFETDAAYSQKRARYFSLLPEVDLETAYVNLTGQIFAPEHQFYVGVRASWAVWEWGASYYAARSASANAEAAAQATENQREQVRIDASTHLEQAKSAASAVEEAQATIASAEEAYRVTDALVKAGSATTTDLLDAQAALTQAKLNLVRARYEQAIANVALTRATGG